MDRFARVSGPAAQSLLLARMRGHEELGRPFEYELELLSESDSVDLAGPLGKPMTVAVGLPSGDQRFFNGLVTKFWLAGSLGRYARYRATVQPWFSLLRRRANCRIFQGSNVREIVQAICADYPFASISFSLQHEQRTLDYVVQYRESDFNFVSRILEQEGFYYFFRHENGKHTMVVADSPDAHGPVAGYESVPYAGTVQSSAVSQVIDAWSAGRQVVSTAYVVSDFDFRSPKPTRLDRTSESDDVTAALELFEYPGGYGAVEEAEALVRARLEEQQIDAEQFAGAGDARGLASGSTFKLTGYPRRDQNGEYLVTSAMVDLAVQAYESGVKGPSHYRCAFSAIKATTPFRPARTTPKPRVEGPQTATVTGPANYEIYTDEYGRVRVQFHWDRYGKQDHTSSCWVRVAQLWAGTNWGAVYVPRIGQEVVVEFLEGDPDRPLVTGCVYNALHKLPFDLSKSPSQSGIQSRSTPGGTLSEFNEIRFEDARGHEELFIQAQRDQVTLVKANQAITVGADRSRKVGANETVAIAADQTVTVGGSRTTTVTKAETETFRDVRVTTVAKSDDLTVQEKHTASYHGGRVVRVDGADDELTVSGVDKNTTVHGAYNVVADTHFQVTQNGDRLLMQDRFELASVGAITVRNGDCEITLKNGELQLTAASKISLQCGEAAIVLTSDGVIELAGASAVVMSGGQAAVELDGGGAAMSGPKVSIAGSGVTEITGGVVKVN